MPVVDETSQYVVPNIQIIVSDYTLPLSEIENFSKEYGPRTGGEVEIVSRWGGPAAGPPEWGGPEIAVAIILGEMLRRASSDAYSLVRSFISRAYFKIRTRTASRFYLEGALAIGVDSERKALRVLFCFPEGLTLDQFEARLRLVEKQHQAVLAELEKRAPAGDGQSATEVRVCWDDQQQTWRECEPAPDESR